jgi:hypothetical protein
VTYSLRRHPEALAVVRLGPGADLPPWAESSSILSVTATAAETSVVCGAAAVPDDVTHEKPFTAFEVQGPLDFSLTGVLAELLVPLADASISVFTLSTFDTDWILVPSAAADRAASEWQRQGHDAAAASAGEVAP